LRNALFPQAGASRIRQLSSQLSICFVKRNRAFKLAARIQNTNLTRPKARAGFRVADCLILLREYRLNAGCASKTFQPRVSASWFN
jgi:hypothetical protein